LCRFSRYRRWLQRPARSWVVSLIAR
jgi:hypothetical protein